jgi:hypothetical protein
VPPRYSRCSRSSLTGLWSAVSPGAGSSCGIAASGSPGSGGDGREPKCPNGPNGEYRSPTPIPPAARPAAFLATCQLGPLNGKPNGPENCPCGLPKTAPGGAVNRAGSMTGSTVRPRNSVSVAAWSPFLRSQRNKMPSPASTIASTCSNRATGEPWNGGKSGGFSRPAPRRALAVRRMPSRPQAVIGPSISRSYPASSHDGHSSAGNAGSGLPLRCTSPGGGPGGAWIHIQMRSPSLPSACRPSSLSMRYRLPGASSSLVVPGCILPNGGNGGSGSPESVRVAWMNVAIETSRSSSPYTSPDRLSRVQSARYNSATSSRSPVIGPPVRTARPRLRSAYRRAARPGSPPQVRRRGSRPGSRSRPGSPARPRAGRIGTRT